MLRIEMRGFKSLAKKTEIAVSDGVTCIAGPNGCGKSNIIDAVRWALGEQSSRALRASAMNEVIFSGTQEQGPGSMASVTLEFVKDGGSFPKSLDGFEQVAITRRLFRSGDSEYLINNVRCRLKDITELFLDTGLHRNGYAIIEQGKVNDIIQARPDEIRYLIEEAAEVGKFRVKRTEALRRLDATSSNLERINDLLSEVAKQRNELKAQANKARRYQEMRKEANELARVLSAFDLERIISSKKPLEDELASIDKRIEQGESERSSLMQRLGSLEIEGGRLKADMESLASRISSAESKGVMARREAEASKLRLFDITSTMDMLAQNMEVSKIAMAGDVAKADTLKREQEGLLSEIGGVQASLASLQTDHDTLVKEHDSLERLYNERRTGLFETIGEVRSLEAHITEIKGRRKEVASTIQARQQDLSSVTKTAEALSRELVALEDEIAHRCMEKPDLMQQIETLEGAMDSAGEGIEGTNLAIIGLEKGRAEIMAKISVLSRIAAEENSGDATLSQPNGNWKVSDKLSVRAGFEVAVGRSMGCALDFLICRDHEEILSQKDLDKISLGFVIERPYLVSHCQGPPAGSIGVVGQLNEFIAAQDGYEEVIKALSQNMWVVDDLGKALTLWNQGHRSCSFVTMDGMILEPTGVIRTAREHTKYAQVLKAKAEMKELDARRMSVDADIEREGRALHEAKQGLKDLTERHAGIAAQLIELEGMIAALMEKKERITTQKERIFEQQRSYEADLVQMRELVTKFDKQLSTLTERKDALDQERTQREEYLKGLDEQKLSSKLGLAESLEQMLSIRERMNDLKVRLAAKSEAIKALHETTAARRDAIDKDQNRIEELENTRRAVEEAIFAAQKDMDEAEHALEDLKALYAAALPEYEKALAQMRTAQEEVRDLQGAIEELERARHEVLLKKKEYEIAYAMNLERMKSRFGQGIPAVPDPFDAEEARQKITDLEECIERMGQINFASLEGFEQAQKRWEDLHRQYEDIIRASTRLKEVISSIERQSIKAFAATFTRVKENFKEIFTSMFGGGKAELCLTAGDEMEAGIEIFASPPFKRLKSMSLLSEGEKTLCAISFIFALFKVNPSPFCILDEVDAPLDDGNIIRLNRLIRSFSQDSQFLIVTHNRHTMEMADILYGVTFDAPGISKVVSMVLDEAQG